VEAEGSPGGAGPLSLTTVRHVHNLISGAYTAAVHEGLIAVSPAPRATPPTMREARERRADYVVWSAEELTTFLEVAKNDHRFHRGGWETAARDTSASMARRPRRGGPSDERGRLASLRATSGMSARCARPAA